MQMLWHDVKAISLVAGVCIGTVISEVLIVSYLVWHLGDRQQPGTGDPASGTRGQPPSQPAAQPPTAELLQEGPSYEIPLSTTASSTGLRLRQMQLQAAEATLLTQWLKLQAEQSALRQKEMQLDQKRPRFKIKPEPQLGRPFLESSNPSAPSKPKPSFKR